MLPHPVILQTWVPAMKLKEPFRGRCFPILNDLNLAMTQRIRELNFNGLFNGVKKLPNPWKCVIKGWGDCIEQCNVKIVLNEYIWLIFDSVCITFEMNLVSLCLLGGLFIY